MTRGQLIRVQEAFEIKGVKRVVSTDSGNVYVCREDEYKRAEAENREPITVGFQRQFVLGVIDEGGKGKI